MPTKTKGDPHYEDLQEIENAAKGSEDLTRQLLAFARKQIIAPQVLDDAYCGGHPGSVAGEFVMPAVRDNGRGMAKRRSTQ